MKTWTRIGSVIVGVLAVAACTGGGEGALDDVDADDDALYAASATLWDIRQIPVCWENATDGDAVQRAWVREQVTNTWDAVSSIDFVGWGACDAGARGIRILIEDSGPHTKGLGNQLDGKPNGMVLNFTFQNWNTVCQGQEERCIRPTAVHEFGHALGFAHEHHRDDTPLDVCKDEPRGSDGDFVIGSWDLASVMNYCNPEWSGNGNLSQTDIDAIRLIYDQGIEGIVVNESDDKCLDVAGGSVDDGAPVIAWPCHGGGNQRWDLQARGDGYYAIVNRQSGKCLDVSQGSRLRGAIVLQWACHGGDNQGWLVESAGGVTRLVAKHSGKCLDLAGSSQADGAKILQWDCHGEANQRWSLK